MQGASRVKEDAEQTKLEAQKQNDRATDIANNATATENELGALEDQAAGDAELAQQVCCTSPYVIALRQGFSNGSLLAKFGPPTNVN